MPIPNCHPRMRAPLTVWRVAMVADAGKGEFILAGPREDALPFFSESGFVPAVGENPADFFIEVAFGFMTSTSGINEAELPDKLRTRLAGFAADEADARKRRGGECTYKEFQEWFGATHGVMMCPLHAPYRP